jgi:hypothetical protein
MIDRCSGHLAAILALAIGALCAGPARAGLGGDMASVRSDADQLQGVVHITLLQQYDIHEITAGSGMRVREFLNRDGVVFAVAWTGPVMPDLQRLLGGSFPAYTAALRALANPGLHRDLRIASSELVVESGGHLRAYVGRAYLPALIPIGTSISDLR